MSIVVANLIVDFVAEYIGMHRVCFRQGNSGSYTCVETTCASIGPCSASCPISVDNDTCPQVLYTGYVQPGCQPLDSILDRIPWTYTFTPVPNCKAYAVLCARLDLESVTITAGGSGYNPAGGTMVNFVGAPSGAANGTVVVGTGGLSSPIITTPGSGYTNGTYTNVDIINGAGTGAKATVIIGGGVVTSVVITTAGTGYLTGTTYSLDSADLGPSTPSVPVVLTITSNYGKVTAVTGIHTTTQFTAVPTVLFIGTGTGATGTAILEDCPLLSVTGCTGSDYTIPAGTLDLGDSVVVCKTSTPSYDTSYDVSQSGNCLCSCNTATIGVTGNPGNQVRYFYNRCGAGVMTGILTVSGSPSSVVDCVEPGSVVFQVISDGAVGTVSYGGAC